MSETTPSKRSGLVKSALIAAAAALVIFLAIRYDLQTQFQRLLEWIEGLGPLGPIIFVLVYVIATVCMISGAVLTLGAGVIFGLGEGFIWSSIASTLGATAAFLVGKYFARDWVSRKVAGNDRFEAIDEAVGSQGWKIVGLTRLSPVFPFVLLNYIFGLTRVKLGHYVLASWIGMMPGTLLYVYLGYIARAATGSEGSEGAPVLEWGMRIVGLLATLVVTIYVTKVARRAMDARAPTAPAVDPNAA